MRGIFILLLSICVLSRANSQEVLDLTLDDCIKYALENNEDLEIARLENDIAATQVSEALSDGLPQVDGTVSLTRNFDIQQAFINDMPIPLGTNYQGQVNLSARQLLFDGSFFIGLKAARTVRELSRREQKQTEVQVVENVTKAYYLVLIAEENLDFLRENFANIDTLLRETEAMFEAGFVEKIDVSRIKVQHNNLVTDLTNNTDLLATSLNILKFQMGMPVTQQVNLVDDLNEVQLTEIEEVTGDAYLNRPEYAVLETNKMLLDLNVMNFKSQYLPNLYANFGLGWNSGTQSFGDLTTFNDETWFKYSSLGATLSIPIFDGLRKRSNIQRNRIQIEQIDRSIDQFANSVDMEVTDKQVSLENARREVTSQSENVTLAEEVYDVTKLKYQEGLGSNLEVVEANTSLKEAQTNYLNALYDAIISQIELKKALGTLYNNN